MPDSQLNPGQKTAASHVNGPALVVAGAGTGKTRVIVERINRLIENGAKPESIVALTFTDKAAQEMTDRVNELRGGYTFDITIATFNAYGEQLLRRFASDMGMHSNFTVLSDIGQVIFLKEHLSELKLDYYSPVTNPEGMLSELAGYFSQLKQHVISPELYTTYADKLPSTDEAEQLEKKRHQEIAFAYKTYVHSAQKANAIDYDDQIFMLINLLQKRPNIAKRLQQEIHYLLVDEFQDTNPMQSQLIESLLNEDKNIMVVGDDDQSIYGFRGATIYNILKFTEKYPKTEQIVLTENYRSSQEILDASYALITNNNPDRLEFKNGLNKQLHAQTSGSKPQLAQYVQFEDELGGTTEKIAALIKKGVSPSEIAVLTRKNRVALALHERLESAGIESRLAGQTHDLYKEPLVRALTDSLVSLLDIRNNTALYHVLTGPLFSINNSELSHLSARSRREHIPLHTLLLSSENEELILAATTLDDWRSKLTSLSVGSICFYILESSGLKDRLSGGEETLDSTRDVLHLQQFFSQLKDYERTAVHTNASAFVESLPLLSTASERSNDDLTGALDTAAVSVLTIHKSKGLEWDHVFIIDVTQGTLPSRNRKSSLTVPDELTDVPEQIHINEERRLMYVAMTRARKELTLSTSFHHGGKLAKKPSVFLDEIFDEVNGKAPEKIEQRSLDLFAAKPSTGSNTQHLIKNGVLTLSVSQLNDYLRCPFDFYYRHILAVPQEPSAMLEIGSLLHSAIEHYNKAKLHKDPIDETALLAMITDTPPKEGFISAQERDRALASAAQSLKTFFDRERSATRIPNKIELPFTVVLNDARIVGRYDAVYDYEGDIEIRDYKSSDTVKNADRAKKRAQASDQLTLYALAWQQMHGELPHIVSLDFFGPGLIGTVKKTQRGIDTMSEKITAAVDGIRSQSFQKHGDHAYCLHD